MSDPRDAALTYAIWDAQNSTRVERQENYAEIEPLAKEVRRWLRIHGWELVRVEHSVREVRSYNKQHGVQQ
jgi:hypothetical protein